MRYLGLDAEEASSGCVLQVVGATGVAAAIEDVPDLLAITAAGGRYGHVTASFAEVDEAGT